MSHLLQNYDIPVEYKGPRFPHNRHHLKSVKVRRQTQISPILQKYFDSLNQYQSEEQLVTDIEATGFKRVTIDIGIGKRSDYVFRDSIGDRIYFTNKSGYIRFFDYEWTTVYDDPSPAQLTREFIHDSKDRLKMILRVALKHKYDKTFIDKWKASNLLLIDFLKTDYVVARKFKMYKNNT